VRPLTAIVLACAATAIACGAPPSYPEAIAAHRAEVDAFMRGDSQSPFPPGQRAAFQPLPYYPIDEQYRVPAALRVAPADEIIEMSTSTGTTRRMRRIGTLAFTLKGQPLTLTAFAEADDTALRRLFVPFGDLTSGMDTYHGGRYLDLDLKGSGVYDLDFNRAYHPYCVFNPEYECPVPPRENRLKVPILAGERMR
jgi:uncharacterized protein (DUF1684 family)